MNPITGLALSNAKVNKTRSILIIVSIVLTTMLLTIIATFCYGAIKSNQVNAGELYGSHYGTYIGINEQQVQEMARRSEFSDIGKMAIAGEVDHKNDIHLYWADETTYKLTNQSRYLDDGAFPEKENEIIGDKGFFKALGYQNPQVGDRISLYSRANITNKYEKKDFVISGLLKERGVETTKKAFAGYVSEGFFKNETIASERSYTVYFRLGDWVDITSDGAEILLKDLAKKCGIDEDRVSVNRFYLMWSLDPGMETIIGGLVIAGCVILFSVMVIYNIFQVGIVQRIQEFGKLKALGATRQQLKGIVLQEGMLLSGIGVPIGLIFGSIVSKFTFSWLMEQANSIRVGVELIETSIFSVPILVLVVVASLLTVRLAFNKPMKMVVRISPVEAMRYQENTSGKRRLRKNKKAIGVVEVTMATLSGNKKRTIATILTMGLSCVLFVVIANFVGNIDNEYDARRTVEYGQFQLSLDYSLRDTAYPENNLDSILTENPLGSELTAEIKQLDGVKDVWTRKIVVLKEKDANGQETGRISSVAVVNKEEFNKMRDHGGTIGTVDYDMASKKDGILFGMSHFIEDYGYTINQELQTEIGNGISQAPFTGYLQGSFGRSNEKWVITEDTYEKLGFSEDGIGYIWVDCDEEDVLAVKNQLNGLLSNIDHVDLETYQDALRTSQLNAGMMKITSYAILTILGLIGFMNMANTIIVSIITRKQELGVLQAIGMTNRQVNRMLQMEGFIFTIGTVVVAMIVGIPIGYALFHYGKSQNWIGLNVYHFPLLEIAIMIIVISILQIILSFVLSRNIRRESLVERIRYKN